MLKKMLLMAAILVIAYSPSSSWAHQKYDAPTITRNEFISQIQYNTVEQRWEFKGEDKFVHVAIEVGYNFGILLERLWEDEPVYVRVFLDNPHLTRTRSFPNTSGGTVKVDNFKMFFIPKNSQIPINDFPSPLKQFEKFLRERFEPTTFKTHATMVAGKHLREQNHFYYLNIRFQEIVPKPEDKE